LLTNDEPVNLRPRLTPAEKDEVNAQIDERLETAIIRPLALDYASLVVLIKKRDGSMRICIDYRQLRKIIKDCYPLLLVEDQFARYRMQRYLVPLT